MIALLFMMKRNSAHQLDRLYRSELSQLRMSPAHRLSEAEIQSAVAASPASAGITLATHKVAAVMAATTAVAGGVCAWQVVRNTPGETNPAPVETCHGASLQSEEPEQIPISDTMVTENVTSKPAETVTTSVETQCIASLQPTTRTSSQDTTIRTIILHDTVEVRDTVYLFNN